MDVLSPPTIRARAPKAAAKADTAPERRRHRPNFFVGFRITNPVIIANIHRLQQRIAERFPEVNCCMIDACTLHVTLCTLHLATEEDIEQAVRIVQEHSYKNGLPAFGEEAPSFDFRGVDFFGINYILYSPLDVTSRFYNTLEELAETLHAAFDTLALTTGPFRKPYAPHLTVWKTTKHIKYVKQLNKTRAMPIEFELGDYLTQSEPEHFGTESPTSIELLSMREKEADGYYKVYQSARLVGTAPVSEGEHELINGAAEKIEETSIGDSIP